MVDERFLTHRLKSTSLAGVVGGVLAGVLFFFRHVVQDTPSWDLFAVVATMAVVKVAVLLYYRTRN